MTVSHYFGDSFMIKPLAVHLFSIFLVLASISSASAETREPVSILLCPLTIQAETSMDFLQKGTGDLLETQLSAKGFTLVRTEKAMERSEAITYAADKNLDSVIIGSLTFLGESVSISAFLIDTETGNNRISFSKIEPDKSKLFDDLSEFTAQMHHDTNKVPSPDQVKIPESPKTTKNQDLIRSPNFNAEINAISIGDVNGDGKKEIVFTELHSVFIEDVQNGDFKPPVHIESKSYLNNLYVDTYDTNHNGIDEIIISAVHARTMQLASYAYEWDGNNYVLISDSMDWFFRSGKRPDTGEPALLGQQQHFASQTFADVIKIMSWDTEKKTYVPGETCPMPDKNMNIYAFDTADLFNKGSMLTMTYTPGDYLKIVEFKQEDSWLSSERHGGSNKYIEPRQKTEQMRFYLPIRIMAGDFNRDGKNEIVTLTNINSTPRVFSNLKNYVEGYVECLGWENLGFETLWTTQKVSGYIPDFDIADMDADGTLDLVYGVVPTKASFLGKQTSYIVMQPIK